MLFGFTFSEVMEKILFDALDTKETTSVHHFERNPDIADSLAGDLAMAELNGSWLKTEDQTSNH